jgi:uncharacterized protein (TIGR03083 family)
MVDATASVPGVGEVGDAYAGCRRRMSELVVSLDAPRTSCPVQACPGWSVHDVVAHVTGVVDDAMAGRLDGVATEPWTDAQVRARRSTPTADVVAEWNDKAPSFEGLLDPAGDMGRQAVTDVVTHEHDIRGALGQPGGRHSDAVRIGFEFVANGMVRVALEHGVALVVECDDGSVFGAGRGEVVLRGERFELLRAMSGRRSVAQLRALEIEGDVDVLLPAFTFGPFHPSARDIDE